MTITQPGGCFKCKNINCVCDPKPAPDRAEGLSAVLDQNRKNHRSPSSANITACGIKIGAQAAVDEMDRYISEYYAEVDRNGPDAGHIEAHMKEWLAK